MPKQIKLMVLTASGVLGLGALLFFNQPTGSRPIDRVAENVLQADRSTHDFGTISMKNGNVKTTFKIKNPTSESVRLSKLYTTCMCTQAKLFVNGRSEGPFGMPGHGAGATFDEILGANEEADIEVEYDPNAHGPSGVGAIERSVILEGRSGKLATLNIKANVTP